MKKPTLIVVTGPTASGKTKLSILLARHFGTEIISADSRQFYRQLNIGTAKPSEEELSSVPHHFINTLNLDDEYNIGKYEQDVLSCLTSLFAKHQSVILCGGSGLYIRAVCNGIDELPQTNSKLRNELNDLFSQQGITALQKKLDDLDPEYYKVVDKSNPHRLIRAIEVCMLSGKKYSKLRQARPIARNFNIVKIGFTLTREDLYHRINVRVDQMIREGLIEEARSVFHLKHLNALNTVGYKELFEYFENKINLNQSISLIKQNSRNYAKRQLTWLKRDQDITWFNPSQTNDIVHFLEDKLDC
jgi:tRNA dimethylallyltransferase